jgi:CMP-N-acetylneuraminic acid synthetase
LFIKYINILDKQPDNIYKLITFSNIYISIYIQINILLLKDTKSIQKEGRIALAIQVFKQGQFKSLLAATKVYNIPYSTVYKYVKRYLARCDLQSPNQKLTDTEESILVQ